MLKWFAAFKTVTTKAVSSLKFKFFIKTWLKGAALSVALYKANQGVHVSIMLFTVVKVLVYVVLGIDLGGF